MFKISSFLMLVTVPFSVPFLYVPWLSPDFQISCYYGVLRWSVKGSSPIFRTEETLAFIVRVFYLFWQQRKTQAYQGFGSGDRLQSQNMSSISFGVSSMKYTFISDFATLSTCRSPFYVPLFSTFLLYNPANTVFFPPIRFWTYGKNIISCARADFNQSDNYHPHTFFGCVQNSKNNILRFLLDITLLL